MDPLAHTLTGITLANTGLKQKVGSGCVLALVIASNVVDVDIFGVYISELPTWAYRRMWTHSLLMAPLLVLLASFVFSKLYRQTAFRTWFFVFLLGASFHIFMDLINSYGVVLFFPLSKTRFELAWVFIIDLYVWGILLFALLAPWILKRVGWHLSMLTSARIGIAMLLGYFALCAGLRAQSMALLDAHAQKSTTDYTYSYAFPEPFGPWRFRGVLRSANQYEVYLIEPLQQKISYAKTYLSDESDPEVAKLVESETGAQYQWFFEAPVWEKQSADSALVSDIRFKSLLLERKAPFTYLVSPGATLGAQPTKRAQPTRRLPSEQRE